MEAAMCPLDAVTSVQLWWPAGSVAASLQQSSSATKDARCYLVGWWCVSSSTSTSATTTSSRPATPREEDTRNQTKRINLQVCVAAVVCASRVEDVVIGLQQVVDDPALTQVLDRCHGEATVLGMVNVQQAEDVLKTFHPQACEQEVWLRVEHLTHDDLPCLVEVCYQGKRCGESQLTSQVIRYDPPAFGHFLTSEPLPLGSRPLDHSQPSVPPVSQQMDTTSLDQIIHQINSAVLIHALGSPNGIHQQKRTTGPRSTMCIFLVAITLFLSRWLFKPVLWVLDRSIPFGLSSFLRIRQATAVGRQLDLRLRILHQCALQWSYLDNASRNPPNHTTQTRVVELSLANSFWLMAVDALAGMLFMMLAWTSSDWLAQEISASEYEYIWSEPLRRGVIFLMNQPGGVKLNPQLSDALGSVFLYLINSWTVLIAGLLPYLPSLLRLASLVGLMGLTMAVALLSDLISFFTLHIFYFYTVSARIYAIMLQVLSSLWKLFRGKKRNVLRQRIDSYSYDIDQLLLGTLLFTVIVFLLPTTFVFYLYFAVLRLLVLCANIAFAFLVEGLNHFPLYSLFLFVSDPKSLPGGVSFSALAVPSEASRRRASYLVLHSRATPPSALFQSYSKATKDVIKRYAPQTLLARFLRGEIMLAV